MDATVTPVAEPKRKATYDDVLAAPEHQVAEILDGELFLSPRPAFPHACASSDSGWRHLELLPRSTRRCRQARRVVDHRRARAPPRRRRDRARHRRLAPRARATHAEVPHGPRSRPTGSARRCRRPPRASTARASSRSTPATACATSGSSIRSRARSRSSRCEGGRWVIAETHGGDDVVRAVAVRGDRDRARAPLARVTRRSRRSGQDPCVTLS